MKTGVKQGKQLVSDTIAQERGFQVTGVLAERHLVLSSVAADFLAGHREQGPQDCERSAAGQTGAGTHPRESVPPSAAEETKKAQFHLIIGLVSERD